MVKQLVEQHGAHVRDVAVVGDTGATYRVYDNGQVIAFRLDGDPVAPGTWIAYWIASLWSAHPLRDPDAKHIEHIALEATTAQLWAAIREWEEAP